MSSHSPALIVELSQQTRAAQAREAAIVGSARWAAWGDALGFITELARDQSEVKTRAGVPIVEQPVAWRRRIGGRFGPIVDLPAGTYSDDTQLRLAVSRCLRSSGRFDAETFSKIELPIFLSYGLGVGRGTRAAAQALGKRGVRWVTNFFETDRVRYVEAGGNGAAMRIQPHVWRADLSRSDIYLRDVVSDAICTHGHARGILGAAFHALVLAQVLRSGDLPEPSKWTGMALYLERLPNLMQRDEALRERWIPLWEQRAGADWSASVAAVVRELESHTRAAAELSGAQPFAENYLELCRRLGGLSAKTRGAGTITAVLALWVAWHARNDPAATLSAATNLLGSDTDTVASIAGALVGAVHPDAPPGQLLDEEYIVSEARRCARLARSEPTEDFSHPDLVKWAAPRTLADALGTNPEGLSVSGLGPAVAVGEFIAGPREGEGTGWQWIRLQVGQTLLIKRRTELQELPQGSLPRHRPSRVPEARQTLIEGLEPEQPAAVGTAAAVLDDALISAEVSVRPGPIDIDQAVAFVKERDFDPSAFGTILLSLMEREGGLAQASLFLGAVTEAYRSRYLRTD
jgi:ADP-ribosylglycohydrolase